MLGWAGLVPSADGGSARCLWSCCAPGPPILGSSFAEFTSFAGAMFCAGTTAFRRVSTARGPVVTITPEGIREVRVAAELIPWSAINDIAIWDKHEMRGRPCSRGRAHSDTSRPLDAARLVRRRTTAIGPLILNEPPMIDANHSVRVGHERLCRRRERQTFTD
jgi:hypothetical protein